MGKISFLKCKKTLALRDEIRQKGVALEKKFLLRCWIFKNNIIFVKVQLAALQASKAWKHRFQRIGPHLCDSCIHMSDINPKKDIITPFAQHEKDTGSCEVQVALISARVQQLTEHLRTHRKDFHSRRGLILLTSRRRRLLNYLKENKPEVYAKLLAGLGLRR